MRGLWPDQKTAWRPAPPHGGQSQPPILIFPGKRRWQEPWQDLAYWNTLSCSQICTPGDSAGHPAPSGMALALAFWVVGEDAEPWEVLRATSACRSQGREQCGRHHLAREGQSANPWAARSPVEPKCTQHIQPGLSGASSLSHADVESTPRPPCWLGIRLGGSRHGSLDTAGQGWGTASPP